MFQTENIPRFFHIVQDLEEFLFPQIVHLENLQVPRDLQYVLFHVFYNLIEF